MSTIRQQRPIFFLSLLGAAAALGIIWYTCIFQVIDIDVWWHITAGRVMRATRALIATEPFAYPRLGEPYLARYEWLAQIFLSLTYDAFGPAGLIMLRSLLITVAFLPILLIHPRLAWVTFILAAFGVMALRPALLDRPQLFSFAIFPIALWLMLLWLDGRLRSKTLLWTLLPLQVLWVNLHGGAALLHLVLAGILLFHCVVQSAWERRSVRGIWDDQRVRTAFLLTVLLPVATLLSPNAVGNLTYVFTLFTDRTVEFIHEWFPRDADAYRRWIFPCWIAGLGSLAFARRHWTFALPILLSFGFLSLQALRHEPFFILAALLLTAHQLGRIREKLDGNAWLVTAERMVWPIAAFILISTAILIPVAIQSKYVSTVRYGWGGMGAYEPLKGACGFLDHESLNGPLFNTFETGAPLLFCSHPHRHIFVDGRNVDHGYAFLKDLFAAGGNATVLRSLEGRYDFTTAVIQYDYIKEVQPLPYVSLFGKFPDWSLVYVDETAAVYVRRMEHSELAEQEGYAVLTPEILLDPARTITALPDSFFKQLEQELLRAERVSPAAPRLRLARAALYFAVGAYAEAEQLLLPLQEEIPYRFEPWNLLAMVRAGQERYGEAATLFEEAIRRAGGSGGATMDYGYLSSLFQRAGQKEKAAYYRKKAGR